MRTGETVDILLDVTNPGSVDGALPHRRAPRERDDVQLRRRAGLDRDRAGEPRTSLVVGAGQAGLDGGYNLPQAGVRFLIVDGADRGRSAWSQRWESLRPVHPAPIQRHAGTAFGGDPDREPTSDEVDRPSASLRGGSRPSGRLNAPVTSLTSATDDTPRRVPNRTILADQVIVATGPFQKPRVPPFASSVAADVYPGAQHRVSTTRRRSRRGGPWSSAAETRAIRSPRSWPPTTRSYWRSDPGKPRSRSGFSASDLLVGDEAGGPQGHGRIAHRQAARPGGTLIGPALARRSGSGRAPAKGHRRRRPDHQLRRRRQGEADAIVWATGYPPTTPGSTFPCDDTSGRVRQRRGVTVARPVHPRPDLAAHPRLGAARLRSRRRGVHQPAGRRASSRSKFPS